MPLDPHVKRFLDRLAAVKPADSASPSVQQRRAGLHQLLSFAGAPVSVARIEEHNISGPGGPLRLRVYTPSVERHEPLPGLVYFHGGGLIAGSLESHEMICCALGQAGECKVVSVDYRLGPEHRFPAAVEDACAAVSWIAAHAADLGIHPDRLGVSGDSAGAILAAVSCQAATQAGVPPLKLQLLLCPILDYAAETPSRLQFGSGYLIDRATFRHDLENYLGANDSPVDPRISPLRAATLAGFPPTVVHTAQFDPARDEGEAYAVRLQQAGVETRYRCHSGMIHLFYGMGQLIPYAATAYELIGKDIRAALNNKKI